MTPASSFRIEITQLARINPFVMDIPKGSSHPPSPEIIHPLDEGCLENSTASENDGFDGWLGSSKTRTLTGILCTFDTLKHDMEIKILPVCTNDDLQLIQIFHGELYNLYIPNSEVNP